MRNTTKRKNVPPNAPPHKRSKFGKDQDVRQKSFKANRQNKGAVATNRGHEQPQKSPMSYMDKRKKYKLKKKKLAEKKSKQRPGRKNPRRK